MSMLHHFDQTDELQTVRDWLRFTVSAFNEAKLSFGHGSANAYDEAAYLILHTLHLPLDTLDPFLDARLIADEKKVLLELLKQRIDERIPVAYLTHEAWLGEFSFYVDERVIVPRSFIAELIREQFTPWIDETKTVTHVLDLCTGSSCLAILATHAFPDAIVDAVDISPAALEVAQRNVSDYGLEDRINLIKSDIFSNLAGKQYDVIISNPPYVDALSMTALPPEYRHEPQLALGSGADGLDATRKILKHAANHLNKNGLLVVEIGHNRLTLETAYPNLPFTWLEVAAGNEFVFMLRREDLI
ncbi:50S ribosomal subunit protein L3 N(5)-glutamine methyltransferase [Candidatus Nitrotoga sp. HW29]|uniref:50S ribosomal protein L3 N(5)-glutamine methyltransferase n=2 Tax=Candidatus Nitrotoga sp. HW29 TaxID=2886963 RepID=UPI001EF24859|nr:50S ribosomal protein L3 N(5)-glutamine methyltransferase [Candidatus Nitrotoga sp. HW29]CAH1904140.1 50S ribosomal subunit protein L3 N(5)-glutamine methyltransferase [Candidatus Nitrotoga sp. HW29]